MACPPQSRRRQRQIWKVELSSRSWKGLEDFLASEGGSELQVMRGWPSSREGPSEVAPKELGVDPNSLVSRTSSATRRSRCNGKCLSRPRSWHGEGNGTPHQYFCLENPMDRGAWWAAVHGVVKSRARLSDFTFTFHFHWRRKWQPTPVFLPGESQERRSLVRCHLWGRTESDTTEAT